MKYFFPSNIWRFLLLIAAGFIAAIPIMLLLMSRIEPMPMQIIMICLLGVAITVLYYFGAKKSGQPWIRPGEFRISLKITDLLLAVCFGGLFVFLTRVYKYFAAKWWPPDVSGQSPGSFEPTIYAFAAIVVLGPILEEWVLRGIFLKSMLTRIGTRNAIIISAVFFGALHFQWPIPNPVQIICAIGLGYYFGYIYAKRGSLVNVVILHMIVNAIGFASMCLFK